MHDPLTVGRARPDFSREATPRISHPSLRWPLARLAVQNLGRRPGRTLVLASAVAVGVGAAFAAIVARLAIAESVAVGFDRMGADLLVVPKEALVNLTPALLTVEPGPQTLDARLVEAVTRVPGIELAAPQRFERIAAPGDPHGEAELVAFDPRRDFTVLPWLKERLGRPFHDGDVVVGGRRPEPIGVETTLGGRALTVYGRLALTGVGPFDRSFFASFTTAASLVAKGEKADSADGPDRVSAVLVRLSAGARPERVRFALAGLHNAKVVSGTPLVTSVRQALKAVLGGVIALMGLMLLVLALLVGAIYTAVVDERRRELGLLLALGARRGQVARMVLTEAGLTTGLGGASGLALGSALLLGLQRTVVYSLEILEVPFVRPPSGSVAFAAAGCLVIAVAIGPLGALLPAWRVCGRDPYDLARSEAM
jgi:putative ABC transport system permease protein